MILDLPPEITHEILSYLDILEFSRMKCVNHTFYNFELSHVERIRRYIEQYGAKESLYHYIYNRDLMAIKYLIDNTLITINEALLGSINVEWLDGIKLVISNCKNITLISWNCHLHNASEKRNIKIMEYLLSCIIDIKFKEPLEVSCIMALHLSIQYNFIKILEPLLSYGIKNNIIKEYMLNCELILAAAYGHLEAVKCLVSFGADVNHINWPNYGSPETALTNAASKNYLKIVKYLVEQNVNINLLDNGALRYAASNGHYKVVKYLTMHGSDIYGRNSEALRDATTNGHLRVVKHLILNGNYNSSFKEFALCTAAENGHLEIVKWLFNQDVDLNCKNSYPIRYASKNNHFKIVKWLLKQRVDLKYGSVVLRHAAKHKNLEVMINLQDLGVNYDSSDSSSLSDDHVPFEYDY